MGGGKRFAVLLCAEDSDYVKKMYGGYYGVFVEMLAEEGETWDVFRVANGEFPDDGEIGNFDGFVITGSCNDAHGNDVWICRLIALLKKLDSLKKKVLGICFGHQASPSSQPSPCLRSTFHVHVEERGTSGVSHKEKKGLEGATSQGKLDQPVAEAEKGLGSGEQDKPDIGITEERKNEVEGEEKVKHARSTTESEEAIKEKESAYCNEGQKTTGINENNKKAEETIQNGSNGSDVGEVKP